MSLRSLLPIPRRSRRTASDAHTHEHADHVHGPGCGHPAVVHEGHVDYVHDGHLHHVEPDGQVDEHRLCVCPDHPADCTGGHPCGDHDPGHTHGRGCGHPAVPHGDHVDYLVDGHLHHPHGLHCDEHGAVDAATGPSHAD
jgi:hypothetical protein